MRIQLVTYKKKGFTLIELLIVIALMMIVMYFSVPSLFKWFLREQNQQFNTQVLALLYKARWLSIIKQENLSWGVCLNGSSITLNSVSCSGVLLEEVLIPNNTQINGLTNVFFTNKGETSQNYQFQVNFAGINHIYSINKAGGIDFE